jgi:hypothetical protein
MAEAAALTLFALPVKVDPFTSYILVPRQLTAPPEIAYGGPRVLTARRRGWKPWDQPPQDAIVAERLKASAIAARLILF